MVMEDIGQLVAEGEDLLGQRRFPEAASIFERATGIDPTSYRAYRGLGIAMSWLNSHCFRAHEVFDEAARLNSGQLDGLALEAYCLSLAYSGQAERSLAIMLELKRTTPDFHTPEMLPTEAWKAGDLTVCHAAAADLASEPTSWDAHRDGLDCPARLEPSNVLQTVLGERANRLDMICKARILGWPVPKRLLFIAAPNVVNRPFLDYWRDHVDIVDDPGFDPSQCKIFNTFVLRAPDGRVYDRNVAYAIVSREWKRRGLPPLLGLSDGDRLRGTAGLREMGVPEGAWYVTLHVRSPSFNDQNTDNHNAMRNADIATYFPAIRKVTEAGGWVLRMGDADMPPLPPMEGVIDYAVGPFKSPWMDIFLCASSAFFMATQSGLVCVAQVFGVPSVVTNVLPTAIYTYGDDDLLIPRKLVSTRDGRQLSFREAFRPPYVNKEVKHVFDTLGVTALAHTAEEISDVTGEMIDRHFGRAVYSATDESLQRRFRRAVDYHGFGQMGRVGRAFLRNSLHSL
jgi:putative glycosyltransferase (TIGR04372 family)